MAPSGGGISIPTADLANGSANGDGGDHQSWNKGADDAARGASPRRRDDSRDRDRDREPRGRGEPQGNNPGNNLHVSGLSHRVDSADLDTAFAKVGRVQKASVMYDPHSRESRGFAFVTMETPEEADAAIAALNATEFMGKIMTVEKARRGRARTPTPGRYYGPPKRTERLYDPRPYDRGYRGGDRYDDRRDRYDDRRYDDRRYDDRRYDDRHYDDRRGGGGGYDDRRGGGGGGGYDDRRGGGGYDDRRYDGRR